MTAPPGTLATITGTISTGPNGASQSARDRLSAAMRRKGWRVHKASLDALEMLLPDEAEAWAEAEFYAWLMRAPFARKRTKVRACDPRRDGRRQA